MRAPVNETTFRTLEILLDLIKDPDKYKQAMEEFKTQKAEMLDLIEKVSHVKDIEVNRAQAISKNQEANAVLDAARSQAKKILQETQEKIQRRLDDLKTGELALSSAQEKLKKDRAAFQRETESQLDHFNKRVLTLDEMEKNANNILNEGKRLQEEFAEKLAQIKRLA